MGIIQEIEALVKIVPQIEKVIADAKAVEQNPATTQLITDLEAIISEAKTVLDSPAPVVAPTITPTPAV